MPDRKSSAAELPQDAGPGASEGSERPTGPRAAGGADGEDAPVELDVAERARFANHTTWESGGSVPAARGSARLEGARDHGGGRYVVRAEIARGGMGRVVAATDVVLGRTVAVKEALTLDPDTVRRFARETEITARLEHPAIVPVYDAGFDADGQPYYVMRKVSGQPLERLVEATRSLSERLALLPHVVAAAQAMAHAHRRAVLHRDLKPSNILIGEFGETVVIDWGLAKVAGQADDPSVDPLPSTGGHVQTQAGAVFGTPGFMSPEQLAGKPVDARSDVYALGATLYFLLAKRAPHHAGSAKEIMALAAAGPPAPIAEVVPRVPRDLAWIVDTALAFDPEKRYPHAGALAAELKNFLTGQLVASRHYTRREHVVRFVRRHRIAVAVAAAAVIALAIAVSRVVVERATAQDALAEAVQERRLAQATLDEMTLTQARTLLDSNPTASIALARRLARSPHWRDVRAIAAAARQSGACVGLPGPLKPSAITIAPGGRAAASTDQEGTVWLHDLDRRTSRTLLQLRAMGVRAAFAGDGRLVVYSTRRLIVVELASGAVRDLRTDLEIVTAAATPTAVFVVTGGGRVIRIELDRPGETALDVTGAQGVQLSPSRRWLAVETTGGLVLVDLAWGGPPIRVTDQHAIDVRWDASSTALTVHHHGSREVLYVTTWPRPKIEARRPIGRFATHQPWRGTPITLDESGLQGFGGAPFVKAASGVDFPLAVARGDTLVVGRRSGFITLLHDRVGVELRAPSDELLRLTASAASPYLVAAAPGRLFVWNVDRILPSTKRIADSQQFHVAGKHRMLLGTIFGEWRWYDADTGAEEPFRLPPGPYQPFHDGSGELAVLLPDMRAETRGFLIARRGRPPVAVDAEVTTLSAFDGKVVVGTLEGEVIEHEPEGRASTVLAARPGQAVISLGRNGRWRAARWADGTLWRRGPDGREERGTLVGRPSRLPVLMQQSHGRVCAAAGPRVECWNPDGSSAVVATLPMDIAWTELLTDRDALVTLADHGIYRVDLATGEVTGIGSTGGMVATIAPGPGLAVARRGDHTIAVIDLFANRTWPLFDVMFGVNQATRITSDGELVTALAHGGDLLTWRLGLPRSPEETERWLDEITNAIIHHGTMKVGWRDP